MCYLNLNEEEMGKKSPDLGIGVQEMRHLTKGSVNGDVTSSNPVLSILAVINDIADRYFDQIPDRNDSSPENK
jgi:hypothetical protein